MAYTWLRQRTTETITHDEMMKLFQRHLLPVITICTVRESRIMYSSVRGVCSRWVSMLLVALVFLSELLCVDVKGLEGVNRQQHVSNVSLEKKKTPQMYKLTETKLDVKGIKISEI